MRGVMRCSRYSPPTPGTLAIRHPRPVIPLGPNSALARSHGRSLVAPRRAARSAAAGTAANACVARP